MFSESVVEEQIFFVVSPKDIVIARLRDQDDHITWLLEQDMFEVGRNCSRRIHQVSWCDQFWLQSKIHFDHLY